MVRLWPVYVAAGVLKHLLPLPMLARWAWRPAVQARDRRQEHRLVACVVKISKTSRAIDRDCFQRSLVLYRELSRSGAGPQLWVGFARSTAGASLNGHAWVIVDGAPLLDEGSALEDCERVVGFGDGGKRLTEQDKKGAA